MSKAKSPALDQTNLIVIIVAAVIGLGGIAAIYFTKPEPEVAPQAPQLVSKPVELPASNIVMVNSLRGSNDQGADGTGASPDAAGGTPDAGGGMPDANPAPMPTPEGVGAGATAAGDAKQ